MQRYVYDNTGRLRAAWDPRTGLKETYAYDANGLLTAITPAGERPWTMSYAPAQPEQSTFGRLDGVSRASLVAASPMATWTLNYAVAVSGSGAPYQMSASEVSRWGQPRRR